MKHATAQPNLFGEVAPVAPKPSPIQKRHATAQAVFEKENELFKQYFPKFVLEFAEKNREFTPEQVRHSYSKTRLPQPRNWRSVGQIFKQLAKDKKLRRVSMGVSADFGCPTPKYSKFNKQG